MDKIKFVGIVIIMLFFVYAVLTICMPVINQLAFETANNSSVAAYPDAQAALRWTPILLYTVPAVMAAGAIAIKLKFSNSAT